MDLFYIFFFFQAEDGIRDDLVTGVQTCALPISVSAWQSPRYETGKYLASLNAEIAKLTPVANRSALLDREIAAARARTVVLDELRSRTKADMDVLGEITRILAPPAWPNQLELTRTQVTLPRE